MLRQSVYQVWRAVRVHDGQGGYHRVHRRITDERGRVGLKSLTKRNRGMDSEIEGGQEITRVSHVGYFRLAADIRRSDEIRSSDGTFVAKVMARRVPGRQGTEAEFDLTEIQRG